MKRWLPLAGAVLCSLGYAGCTSGNEHGSPQDGGVQSPLPDAGATDARGLAPFPDSSFPTPPPPPPPPPDPDGSGPPRRRTCAADAGLSRPPDADDDIIGLDGCRPATARLVVLGDSIAACWGTAEGLCSVNRIAGRIRELASPDLVVESHAILGSGVGDLPREAAMVAPGRGHLYVWIFSVGNDLLAGLVLPGSDLTAVQLALIDTFGYFTDRNRFPDGATFLLNGQYGPYDQCAVPGAVPGYSPPLAERLQEINRILFFDTATGRADTVAIDQYPDWLGHGNNADVYGCPYCGEDNTKWMLDRTHPNALGHAHIAEKWSIALERMLDPGCGGDG